MNMTGEYNVDFALDKPRFEHNSHALSFHVVVSIAVVPWGMNQNNQPWGFRSVYFSKLFLKPFILWGVCSCHCRVHNHLGVTMIIHNSQTLDDSLLGQTTKVVLTIC